MINTKHPDGTAHYLQGDSLHDVALFLKTHWPTWSIKESVNQRATPKWDMSVGYNGAWKLAHDGWSQGAADLAVAIQALEPDATMPEIRFDMGGEWVDVPRYLGGNPACMARHGKVAKREPVVSMVVSGAVSHGVSAQAITAYGAALTAIIDQLENAGRRVELDVAFVVEIGSRRAVVGWKVKKAEDHLDLAAIAFSIQHPAAFRRIAFAMIERSFCKETKTYGMPGEIRKSDLPFLNCDGAFILPGIGISFGVDAKLALPMAVAHVNRAAGEELISAS